MSGVKVILATGDPALVVDSVSIEGERLCIRGRLLGTMQARMYLGPKEILGLSGIALRGWVPLYLLLLPLLFIKGVLKNLPVPRRQS